MSHSAPVTHDVPNGYMTDRGLHILHVSIYDSIGRGPKGWWSLFQTYRARGHGSWLAVGHKLGNDPNVLPRRSVITTNVRCPTLANFPLGLAKLAGHGPKRASNCRKEARCSPPAARRRRYTIIQSGTIHRRDHSFGPAARLFGPGAYHLTVVPPTAA